MKLTKFLSYLLLLSTTTLLYGHNGASIVAHPINGITVDGHLDDWPEGMTIYEASHADFGDSPKDKDDLHASFRVGYNASDRALFIAVEVLDSSIVLDPLAGKDWDTQDGCSIYIDRLHAKGVSTPVQYFQCGDNIQVHGYKADQAEITSKVLRGDGKITYEWRVPLDDAFTSGRSLGLDLDVTDKDEDGSFTWVGWTPGTRKAYYASKIGDLFLLPQEAPLGSASGRLAWSKGSAQDTYPMVSLQSESNLALRVETTCDTTGRYHVDLPVGRYTIKPIDTMSARVMESAHTHVHVTENQETLADPLVISPITKPDAVNENGLLHDQPFASEAIDRFVREHMDYHKIPGVALAVVTDSKISYSQTYGVENAATKKPVQPGTVFEACSLTKPIFGFAVNRLIERGLLDLDTPLNTYLPDAPGYADYCPNKERYRRITARHVLSHRTGFPNWRSSDEIPVTFEPGNGYGYSGEGFELLGAVVSHLTKKDLIEILKEEVFTPLKVANAHLIWSDTLASRVGNGHTDGRHPIPKSKTTFPGMAHSLHIDAPNYANFMIGILNRDGLSEATYKEMLRTQYERFDPDNPHEYPYGLGLISEDTKFGKKYWHGGSNSGWKCMFAIFDELKMGYVVFTNNDSGHEFAMDLEKFLITGSEPTPQAD